MSEITINFKNFRWSWKLGLIVFVVGTLYYALWQATEQVRMLTQNYSEVYLVDVRKLEEKVEALGDIELAEKVKALEMKSAELENKIKAIPLHTVGNGNPSWKKNVPENKKWKTRQK